jgi:hypothetical protein
LWRSALARWRAGSLTADDTVWINWGLRHLLKSPAADKWPAELQAARQGIESLEKLPPPVPVLAIADGTPEDQRVSIRGNPRTLGETAPRQLPAALGGIPPGSVRGSGRLELARHIADPANPLTARVMVNRLWHHMLGRGIVASVDNFGVLGDPPTHPELLDFLALQFVQRGWSIKQMLREIALSSTYQMSSVADRAAAAADPDNTWLHSMRIRRLESEAIRDSILAVSGQLDRTLEGPSVPVHVTSFMQGRGRPKESGPLDGAGRRSVYVEVRRNFLPPMMLAFDTPIPFNTLGRRNTSNVPAQALILMNDPFVAQQAEKWAERLLAEPAMSLDDRVRRAYRTALARWPSDAELHLAREFFERQGRSRNLIPGQAELDPVLWADFCHVVMNMKEFVFVN